MEVGGFAVFNDREKTAYLRTLAEKRGLILFTDPDGAGFVIRSHLKSVLPPDRLKQAYIPDIPGKERRKSAPARRASWAWRNAPRRAARRPPPRRRDV